ncbi:hypothetical protein J437_LFUL004366 [Ladona fulva]|uniref:CCHC-type domain-containing protein n=1 Tax=Ladona fulva TaxID=123851 RepID=A0A8K0K6P5_LADFU|nr:hypothetical protein J437_LFUL004366 [Ladona fulva]
METVKQKLLQEGYRMSTDIKASVVAFATGHKSNRSPFPSSSGVKSGTGSRKKSAFDISKVRCHRCHEYGHMARDCLEKNTNGRENNVAWLTAMSCEEVKKKWYIDSCSLVHMTRCKDLLTDFDCDASKNLEITVANNQKIGVASTGVAQTNLVQGGVQTISNVYYAPDLSANLLSVSCMTKNGSSVLFTEKGCEIYESVSLDVKGNLIASGSIESGVYTVDINEGKELTGKEILDKCLAITVEPPYNDHPRGISKSVVIGGGRYGEVKWGRCVGGGEGGIEEDEELPTVGEEELPNAGEEGVQHNLVGEENAELRRSSRLRVPRTCPCCYLSQPSGGTVGTKPPPPLTFASLIPNNPSQEDPLLDLEVHQLGQLFKNMIAAGRIRLQDQHKACPYLHIILA